MLHATISNRSQLIAAMTIAAGLLTVSPPAQAHPILPLAPACSQWGFPGNFSLKQSNGDTVQFKATGPAISGFPTASATGGINGPFQSGGGVYGGVKGNHVDFDIDWRLDESLGRYIGVVGNDGFAHGSTYDVYSPAPGARWLSLVPLVCTTPAG